MSPDTLRMALPDGPAFDLILRQLHMAGIDGSDWTGGGIYTVLDAFGHGINLELCMLNPVDIGIYVQRGICQLGVMATEAIHETEVDVWRPFTFTVGICPLVLAAHDTVSMAKLLNLNGLRIATSLPRATQDWFSSRGVAIEVVAVQSREQTACLLGLADAYVGKVVDPSSLVEQGFRVLDVLGHSCLKLIVNNTVTARQRRTIEGLLERLTDSSPPAPKPMELPMARDGDY
jgi:ATP phosphoribosyltransferase